MSKLGIWREPNWYWDEQFAYLGWGKKEVQALLRLDWKARQKGKNIHAKRAREKPGA